MSKYYKAEDIEAVLADKHMNRPLDSDRWVIGDIGKSIADLPTIEVSEGEWLFEEYPDGYYHSECSICKHWFIEDAFLKPYKYCPNCGAKMKGADDES